MTPCTGVSEVLNGAGHSYVPLKNPSQEEVLAEPGLKARH